MPDSAQTSFGPPQNAEQRAELCQCGHTRGNHRWHAIGGKRPCYSEHRGVRCACKAFVLNVAAAINGALNP